MLDALLICKYIMYFSVHGLDISRYISQEHGKDRK